MTFDTRKKKTTGTAPGPVSSPLFRPQQERPDWQAPRPEVEAAVPAVSPAPLGLTHSRSAAAVQRAQAAPALTAAELLAADGAISQRAASDVGAARVEVEASRAALADRHLPVETATALGRRAPRAAPPPPALPPLQRHALTDSATHDVTAAFTRDARYVPGAIRAEMALSALQRAVAQGADGEALHAHLDSLIKTPQDRAAVGRAVTLGRQQEAREARAREDHALQVEHTRVQRRLDEALGRQAEASLGTVAERVQARRGGGEPLPAAVQRHLEGGLNAGLDGVRVHTDAEADELARRVGAKAFTSGADLYFRQGAYRPDSAEGLSLLAHEATHVLQQAQGRVGPGLDPDAGLEAEARRVEDRLGRLPPGTEGRGGAPATLGPAADHRPRAGMSPAPGTVQRRPQKRAGRPRPQIQPGTVTVTFAPGLSPGQALFEFKVEYLVQYGKARGTPEFQGNRAAAEAYVRSHPQVQQGWRLSDRDRAAGKSEVVIALEGAAPVKPRRAPRAAGTGGASPDRAPGGGAGGTAGTAKPGANTAPVGEEAAAQIDWEHTGDLRGHPPVRDRHTPPNVRVIEDEAVYGVRLAAAQATLAKQQARAASMLRPDGGVSDYRYWFDQVYSYVTEEELRFTQAGAYYYPSYVLACVEYFDRIYSDNFEAFSGGGRVEEHWKRAFTAAGANQARNARLDQLNETRVPSSRGDDSAWGDDKTSLLVNEGLRLENVIDSLVKGMLAHIRFDLPRAESWVFGTSYRSMEGVRIDNFYPDFMSMAGVFDNAGARMNAVIEQRMKLPVTLMGPLLQDLGMNLYFRADMGNERIDTWRRADMLAGREGNRDPYAPGPRGSAPGKATDSDNLSAIGDLPDPLYRPSMDHPAGVESRFSVLTRLRLGRMSDEELAGLPPAQHARLLRELMGGITSYADAVTMMRVVRLSPDVVTLLDAADAHRFALATWPWNGDAQAVLVGRYYPNTAFQTALRLIKRCVSHMTWRLEANMTLDILESRRDGRELVARLGEELGEGPGTPFERGVRLLKAQTWISTARLHRALGLP